MTRAAAVTAIVLTGLCVPSIDMAAEELPVDVLRRAELVIAGHRDAREALSSGVFRAKGRKVLERRQAGQRVVKCEGPLQLFGAFEDRSQRLRFDRRETHWADLDPTRPLSREFRYAKTPEFSATLHLIPGAAGSRVNVHRPDLDVPLMVGPIDPRNLGSLNAAELQNAGQFPYDFDWVFSDYLVTRRLVEATLEPPSVDRLSWKLGPDGEVKRTIWFDENQGFGPVRFEERYAIGKRARQADRSLPMWDERADQVAEVTWQKTANTWVPTTFSMKEWAGLRGATRETTGMSGYTLELSWERVNEALPQELFTPEGLASDQPGAMIVDFRGGTPPITLRPPKIQR